MKTEQIKSGITVAGVVPDENVTIENINWYDKSIAEIIYKRANGAVESRLLYESDIQKLQPVASPSGYTFGCSPSAFRLVAEARRISQAYLYDPFMAVHSSAIQPLPHQITAVYEKMLPRHPLRYVLADDPGAGKTIMAGLLLKELLLRADVKRALIVSPGNLVEQWQDELYQKFSLHFEIMTNDMLEGAASGNAFLEHNLLIARLDKLSRNEDVQAKLKAAEWDIVIIDEAHKLSATVTGNKINYTKRYNLGKLLSKHTRHFLLMTATPHSGSEANFLQFMSLIDEDRFQCHSENVSVHVDTSDVMRRLVKEELLKFDGTPLFPERVATTVSYTLSGEEQQLYDEVTDYVRDQFNRADRLKNKGKKLAVGFALTVLQRRLASSPEAIYQSLSRRLERLEKRYQESEKGILYHVDEVQISEEDEDDIDDLPDEELEGYEEQMLDGATAAMTLNELRAEIESLKVLRDHAAAIRYSGHDRKWEELSSLLQAPEMRDADGRREKIIIFTEHKDTLNYLKGRVITLIGDSNAVITIQGGMGRAERKNAEQLFKQDKDVTVLIATDAAGEGINLQRAHLMINYDLPWNPNRIEQRFGRIHRIGQTEICHLWNMVASNTREGQVFERLFRKLEQERESLGGKVFDILGKVEFDNKPLRDLLVEAIRYGNDPKHKNYINTVVDKSLDRDHLMALLKERALSDDVLDISTVNRVREDMERAEARRLQPFYIQSFFNAAMEAAGGAWHRREGGRFEITRVPVAVQHALNTSEYNRTVLRRYERICFTKEAISVDGKPDADLIAPGHPLMDALIAWVDKTYGNEFSKGTIMVSETGSEPRLLCSLDTTIRDAVSIKGEQRIISRELRFVSISPDGTAHKSGYAPYLDYADVPVENIGDAHEILDSAGAFIRNGNFKQSAIGYAVRELIPEQLEETRSNRLKSIEKIESEVRTRLRAEIAYWDSKVIDYQVKIDRGDTKPITATNMAKAKANAEELNERMKDRLAGLDKERQISPMAPIISGVAFVIPRSMLGKGMKELSPLYGKNRDAIEAIAMNRIMEIEKSAGFIPADVSADNCGYDIESAIPPHMRTPDTPILRAIEVKGRSIEHKDHVTVTRNEILTALNIPDRFILALVTVDNDRTYVTYCMRPFREIPEASMTAVTFDTDKLIEQSDIIYQEERR